MPQIDFGRVGSMTTLKKRIEALERPELERCGRCKFWLLLEKEPYEPDEHPDEQGGVCRRYPPVLDLNDAPEWDKDSFSYTNYRYWNNPVVPGAGYCGEFKKATK